MNARSVDGVLPLVIISMSLLFGCDFRNHDEPEVPTEPKTETESEPIIVAEVLPRQGMNHYRIKLTWNLPLSDKWLLLHRKEDDSVPVMSDVLPGKQKEYFDDRVEAGRVYQYSIKPMEGAESLFESNRVTVPKDLAITGIIQVAQINGGRIYLSEEAKIMTGGKDLTIQVSEIHSEGGEINTSPGTKGKRQADGRSAGRVYLHALKAMGNLRIEGNGEQGSEGEDGVMGQPGKKGADGLEGQWDVNPEYAKRVTSRGLDLKRMIEARKCGPQDLIWKSRTGEFPAFICSRPPTDGAPGGQGGDGGDGGPGGIGGDSAEINVHIELDSDFIVDIYAQPGFGGLGGRGGTAGMGGLGGEPGRLDAGHLCPRAKEGIPGKRGRDGRVGRQGERGESKPRAVKIGNKVVQDL